VRRSRARRLLTGARQFQEKTFGSRGRAGLSCSQRELTSTFLKAGIAPNISVRDSDGLA